MEKKQIGVLAVQGAFAEHIAMVRKLGAEAFEIRQLPDLERPMDGLILPGGESTAMRKLLDELGLYEPLRAKIAAGLPVYPTADSMVRDGGLATVGINYTVLGGQTADMVCRVLEGTPIADIPVELVNESSVVVNGDTAAALGVDVSRYVQ
jgi:hypothetical protein